MTREELVAVLRDKKEALWPLIDYHSCVFCARPRKPEYARDFPTCWDCKQHRKQTGNALEDLIPITYSTPEWRTIKAIARFKDVDDVDPGNDRAACFGAVLSTFLEAQFARICLPSAPAWLVVPVPSSKPTIVSSLERARREGWWVPELTTGIVGMRQGAPRQRQLSGKERAAIDGKWLVDAEPFRQSGPPVLLIDDIYTTGGSIHSLAHQLRLAGARYVKGLVIARNLGDDGVWAKPLLEAAIAAGGAWVPERAKRDIIGVVR